LQQVTSREISHVTVSRLFKSPSKALKSRVLGNWQKGSRHLSDILPLPFAFPFLFLLLKKAFPLTKAT